MRQPVSSAWMCWLCTAKTVGSSGFPAGQAIYSRWSSEACTSLCGYPQKAARAGFSGSRPLGCVCLSPLYLGAACAPVQGLWSPMALLQAQVCQRAFARLLCCVSLLSWSLDDVHAILPTHDSPGSTSSPGETDCRHIEQGSHLQNTSAWACLRPPPIPHPGHALAPLLSSAERQQRP